ncbi:MAG: putative DNA binding domain-containing protein, partial [Clostridia bacterium]|nr:putative DNA binding domain-containing protein [Clostridia bacterium]
MGYTGENQYIEYKETWHSEYLEWICAFANTDGGTLFIGVRDDGKVIGVKDAKRLAEDIPNATQSKFGFLVNVEIRSENNMDYLAIRVDPQAFPINCNGQFYVRSGATKQALHGNALTEFLLSKTGIRWEDVIVPNISVADLDKESFDIFRKAALRSKRMVPEDLEVSREELLNKLGLLKEGRLTRAAVLCFYRHPEDVLNGCFVKIGKFNRSEIEYQDDFYGSLMLIADRVFDMIYLKYLKAKISYYNEIRVETYPYAKDAVREAVNNALIHSDWSAAVPVQIKLYDDRMEIGNRCILPEGWTKENLIGSHISSPFNPSIAKVFFRAGYIENWGRGIQKIFDACEIVGSEPPEFDVTESDLTVILHALKRAKIDESGSSRIVDAEPNPETDRPNRLVDESNFGSNGVIRISDTPMNNTRGLESETKEPESETKDIESET